eukprot:11964248-Alexandrium_andersonii.AAC.1
MGRGVSSTSARSLPSWRWAWKCSPRRRSTLWEVRSWQKRPSAGERSCATRTAALTTLRRRPSSGS